jgi:hypothetical protein
MICCTCGGDLSNKRYLVVMESMPGHLDDVCTGAAYHITIECLANVNLLQVCRRASVRLDPDAHLPARQSE